MEISSTTGHTGSISTWTKALGEVGNTDAFSELFAMLFSNMLMPSNNPYSLLITQESFNSPSGTSKNSIEETQALSILEFMRTGSDQFKNIEGFKSTVGFSSLIGNLLKNNNDFQKLFNFDDNISSELNEFINSIKGVEGETTADILSKDSINNKTAEPEVEVLSELYDAKTENSKDEELKKVADEMNLKKEVQRFDIPLTEKPADSDVDKLNTAKGADDGKRERINDSLNTQELLEGIKPEEKGEEPDNSMKLSAELNNFKSLNIDKIDPEPKAAEIVTIKNPQDIIDVAVEKFKTLKLPGYTEVTVKLKPEDLGEVSLKLVLEKGQINGSITTDRKEVAVMLQNNLDQLRADLKENNVNLNHLSVNIQAGEEFDRNSNQRGYTGRGNKNNPRFIKAFEEEMEHIDMPEGFNIIA